MSQPISMADIGALFHVEPKSPAREKIRPLGALSDYVVEKFSADLKRVQEYISGLPSPNACALGVNLAQVERDGLTIAVERMLEQQQLRFHKSELGVARLDAMMLEAGLRAHGAKCGPHLAFLVQYLSQQTGQKPILSYQDIILHNPPGDMRTFTDGACGKQEADFYIGHQMIESCLWRRHQPFATIH